VGRNVSVPARRSEVAHAGEMRAASKHERDAVCATRLSVVQSEVCG
jgi:hypothetical protein